ncbi:hypothetical protein GCM10008957_49050 [Deinococcus ruber]|uniref:Uncharacterized protein n=1 Tax=Deinococcus ruber TaxID=1848197 RepID=A0A918FD83_9DEIO|nr:hypothetical protein GCM10008957_49050 [Deinococcus ruber]
MVSVLIIHKAAQASAASRRSLAKLLNAPSAKNCVATSLPSTFPATLHKLKTREGASCWLPVTLLFELTHISANRNIPVTNPATNLMLTLLVPLRTLSKPLPGPLRAEACSRMSSTQIRDRNRFGTAPTTRTPLGANPPAKQRAKAWLSDRATYTLLIEQCPAHVVRALQHLTQRVRST